jgi:hypothetical protein
MFARRGLGTTFRIEKVRYLAADWAAAKLLIFSTQFINHFLPQPLK